MSFVTFVTNSTPVPIHLATYCMILETKITWLFPPKVSVEHHKDWEERVRQMVRSLSQLTIILTSLHFIVNLEFRIEFCKEPISPLRLLPFLGQIRWLSFLRSQTHPIVMVSEWVREWVSEGDHWMLKYTDVQSQQRAFTQNPSLGNNPKILNNYLIFTVIVNFSRRLSFKIYFWTIVAELLCF